MAILRFCLKVTKKSKHLGKSKICSFLKQFIPVQQKRACDTAEGINKELASPVEIFYTDKLRELGLGTLEGQSIDEMYQKYPENLPNLRNHLDLYDPSPFHGETIESAITRIETVVADAVAQHKTDLFYS